MVENICEGSFDAKMIDIEKHYLTREAPAVSSTLNRSEDKLPTRPPIRHMPPLPHALYPPVLPSAQINPIGCSDND